MHKYLFFDSTDKNKELLKKCSDVFNGIRDKIKEVSSVECDYEKDYMKVKFNSDEVFLDDTLYELTYKKNATIRQN